METKAVLITGTATGIGHAACELFAEKGWQVFAGSRRPAELSFQHPSIEPTALDVNDPASVAACFEKFTERKIVLTCVVNNAGYGLLLPFEDTPRKNIEELFRTNVFGAMEVSRCAVRMMREHGGGTIINIASILGRIGAPWYTAYGASKWALEGFSESLLLEVRPFGIRVKIVEPGGTQSKFHDLAYDTKTFPITEAYRERYEKKHARFNNSSYDTAESVAALIFAAATDPSWTLRYPSRQTRRTLLLRRIFGSELFIRGVFKRLK